MSSSLDQPALLESLEPRFLLSSGALIVTSDALAGAFQDVANWYTRKGFPAQIVTTESIYSAYSGADSQEKIRNCIRDYHQNHGVKYVLLGGDNSIVPDRDTKGYKRTDTPTDFYYSSLSGTWDDNGDGLYGEGAYDTVNFAYDTIVGRYPVRTAAHVQTLLAKVIAYETAPPTSNWATDMLAVGEELWDPGDVEYKTLKVDELYVEPYWADRQLDTFFDTSTSWDSAEAGDYTLNSSNLLTAMGNDYQFMHMATHGWYTSWSLESGSFTSSTVAGMTESINVPIVSTIACHTGAFDKVDSSLSEAFLRSDKTGTVVYIGCSREGWGIPGNWIGPSYEFSYNFYKKFLTGSSRLAGEVFAEMKAGFASRSGYEGSIRWLQYGINFQGDPMVQMYRDDPTMLAPTLASEITEGAQAYSVGNLPGGAKVVLWQGDNVYEVGYANGAGTFSTTIDAAVGSMKVTVIADDAAVYTDDVTIAEDARPYTVNGSTVVFDGSGADDVFNVVAGQTKHTVTFNGEVWRFNAAQITRVVFNGNGGADRATLTGTSAADTASMAATRTELVSANYTIVLNYVADVRISGGANDTANLFGTAGDDMLTAKAEWTILSGLGYRYTVLGFGTVAATAGAGGTDVAHLYDSAGDDVFTATPTAATLRGTGFDNTATGFDSATAHCTAGGNDVATLYDSAGDDTFSAGPTQASLSGSGFANTAKGFDLVTGYCTAGGTDTVHFYDAAGNDRLTATLDQAWLKGAGYKNVAKGSGQISGNLTNGTDTLLMYAGTRGSGSGTRGAGSGARGSYDDASPADGARDPQAAAQVPVSLLSDKTLGAFGPETDDGGTTGSSDHVDVLTATLDANAHRLRLWGLGEDNASTWDQDTTMRTAESGWGEAAHCSQIPHGVEPVGIALTEGDIDTELLGNLGLDWLADLTV